MLSIVLTFLKTKLGIIVAAAAVCLLIFGAEELRVGYYKHQVNDLKAQDAKELAAQAKQSMTNFVELQKHFADSTEITNELNQQIEKIPKRGKLHDKEFYDNYSNIIKRHNRM